MAIPTHIALMENRTESLEKKLDLLAPLDEDYQAELKDEEDLEHNIIDADCITQEATEKLCTLTAFLTALRTVPVINVHSSKISLKNMQTSRKQPFLRGCLHSA